MKSRQKLLKTLEKDLTEGLNSCDSCRRILAQREYSSYRSLLVELNQGEPGEIFEAYSSLMGRHKDGRLIRALPIVPSPNRNSFY